MRCPPGPVGVDIEALEDHAWTYALAALPGDHVARDRSVALFVRPSKSASGGRTLPYSCAGLAAYVDHESDRPGQITWRLHHPLPGDVFAAYRAAVA